MSEIDIHEGEPGFEEFVEEQLESLAARANEKGICLDCLSGRLIIEIVAGMTRSGQAPSNILGLVADGLDSAEEGRPSERASRPHNMH